MQQGLCKYQQAVVSPCWPINWLFHLTSKPSAIWLTWFLLLLFHNISVSYFETNNKWHKYQISLSTIRRGGSEMWFIQCIFIDSLLGRSMLPQLYHNHLSTVMYIILIGSHIKNEPVWGNKIAFVQCFDQHWSQVMSLFTVTIFLKPSTGPFGDNMVSGLEQTLGKTITWHMHENILCFFLSPPKLPWFSEQ